MKIQFYCRCKCDRRSIKCRFREVSCHLRSVLVSNLRPVDRAVARSSFSSFKTRSLRNTTKYYRNTTEILHAISDNKTTQIAKKLRQTPQSSTTTTIGSRIHSERVDFQSFCHACSISQYCCSISEMLRNTTEILRNTTDVTKLWKSGLSLCGLGSQIQLSFMIEEFGGACLRSELFYCLR